MTMKEFYEKTEEEQPTVTIHPHEGKEGTAINIPVAKRLPATANLTRSILNRNRMGAISQIQSQVQKFKATAKSHKIEKAAWVETSKKMSDLYSCIKEEIIKEKKQAKSIVKQKDSHEATKFDEIAHSDLVKDALEKELSELVMAARNRSTCQSLVKIGLFQHLTLPGAFSIYLWWDTQEPPSRGSTAGLSLIQTLETFGLVNHTVWIEKI